MKEAKDIAKGKAKPSRHFELVPPDEKAVRKQSDLSQNEFAQRVQV